MRKLGSRYVLHELIGQGTAGQVWRGAHVPDGEPVAIKVLRPELAHDPEVVDRFLRECDLLVQLDSPDLVRVRDLIQEPGTLAIVMDLVEGIDLRAHLDQSGPRPATEAVRLAVGLLWALDSVHSAGIIHRDVKPENVLIDTSDPRRPFVRLTDFGVARVIHTPGRASLTGPIGTPLYMAPELADELPLTPAVDIYAAGVVLYELLAGSPPFDEAHPADLMRAHREDRPLPIQGVPPAVWDVLAAMLAKSPQQRPASAADAAQDLLDALEDDQDNDLDLDDEADGDDSRWDRDRDQNGQSRQSRQSPRKGQDPRVPGQDHATGIGQRTAVVARPPRVGADARAAAFDAAHTQVGGIAPARDDWDDAHTQVGGIPPARDDWDEGAHTQIAGIPPVRPSHTGSGPRTVLAGTSAWNNDDDAATGAVPAVRVPARSTGTAADRNTVISASKDSAPAAGPGSPGAPARRAAADRRRRTRIAAGAGLVVALVAGAGGWALAAAGNNDTVLTSDAGRDVTNPSAIATLPGGIPVPSGMDPADVGAGGQPGAGGDGRTRPNASGSPGSNASPGTNPTQSGPATASANPSTSPSTSPSPTAKDETMPDVQGQSQAAAKNTLSGKGFTNVTTKEECRKGKSGGTVLDQNPNPGSVVPVSTKVTLTVQPTNCVEVPPVAGQTLAAARSTLVGAGLGVLNGSGGCQHGPGTTAASTNPGAGTMMRKGDNVWLEPACAPPPAPAPTTSAPTPAPAAAR